MPEPRHKDWKETWSDYSDVELSPEDQLSIHVRRRMDDDSPVRFDIEQQVKGTDGQPWPVHRTTYDDGTITLEEFGKESREPLNKGEGDAETNSAAEAFLQVGATYAEEWQDYRWRYDHGGGH